MVNSSSHSRQPYEANDWITLHVCTSFHDSQGSAPTTTLLTARHHITLSRKEVKISPQPFSSHFSFKTSQYASRLPIATPEQHVMSPSDAIYPSFLYTGFATRSLSVRASYPSPTPADRSVFWELQRRAALCSQHHFLARPRTRSQLGFNLSSSKCSKLGARRRRATAVGCRKSSGVGQSLREVNGGDSEQGQSCTFDSPVPRERPSLFLLCFRGYLAIFCCSLHTQRILAHFEIAYSANPMRHYPPVISRSVLYCRR